ncbi:MDR family MFS transporter [Lactobacillus psittaci]|uniref:Multidrug resistance protein n=1 Tax=Lactobacillus psittaci DSM 15354 TaxID=1122152 RepID=A0A0R1S274_9LACO|nr:MFS transporter [Lactobacillus psittaci]KRL63261.1 multidrug resistance protein [Lactobacillus psittaci DSM 15354]
MKTAHGASGAKEVNIHSLLLGELITWLGSSFIWPLTSVYLKDQLHVSLTWVGVVLFFNCMANLVGSMIAGRLYDRINPYPLIVVGLACDAFVLFLLAVFPGWPEYWLWLTLAGFFAGWDGALINSMATSIKKVPSKKVFNLIYFAQNIGVVTGTLVVGYLYDFSVIFLFILAGILYTLATVNAIINYRPIVQYHKEVIKNQVKAQKVKVALPKANKLMNWGLFLTLGITWLMYMNWESNLSVYIVGLGIPFHMYSLLWTVNALIIVIVQAVLTHFEHIFKSTFQQVCFGILMFSLSFVTLVFAREFYQFLISMIVLTLGEATAFPAIPSYVNDLTPIEVKGEYQGLTIVASSAGRAIGPLIGGLIIDHFRYIPFFIFAAIVIFFCLVVLVPMHTHIKPKIKLFK